MKPSERFYELAEPLWRGFLDHPFVAGLGDGTLGPDKFRFYMIQDHKYLMEYAKLFALGVVNAKDEDDMRLFSSLIQATLDTENAIHQAYLKEFGVTPALIADTPATLNNKSYTSYMLAEAAKGSLPEIAAAALACSWSYKLIGDELAKIPGALDHPLYGRWVAMYSSPEFSAANDQMISLVDKYCAGLGEEDLKRLDQIILDCTAYEEQFWTDPWQS